MQKLANLGSPFRSPCKPTQSDRTKLTYSPLRWWHLSDNHSPGQYVSLPQIQWHPDSDSVHSENSDLACNTYDAAHNFLGFHEERNLIRSSTSNLEYFDEHHSAGLGSTLRELDSWPNVHKTQSSGTPYGNWANSTLDLSSSPVTNSQCEPQQHAQHMQPVQNVSLQPSPFRSSGAMMQSSSPPAAPLPPQSTIAHPHLRFCGQPATAPQKSSKRSRQIGESQPSSCKRRKSIMNIKVLSTPEINSDPDLPVVKCDDQTLFRMRSQTQVNKVVTRGVRRARALGMYVRSTLDSRAAQAEDGMLVPLDRPSPVTDFHGEPTRQAALARLPPRSLVLRGQLKCRDHADQWFSSFEALASHLDTEHTNTDRAIICPVQNCVWSIIGFTMKSECHRHIKSAHEPPVFVCELCERESRSNAKSFGRVDSLRRHLRNTHAKFGSQ